MKRTLLACAVLLTTIVAQAQIITFINEPASVAGNKDFMWADPPDWGTMDLNDPANSIEDTLAFAFDDGMNTEPGAGITADTLACGPVISDVDGKIAVLWRGSCEFGDKAINAQNAGAVGVIIINHSGAPVGMGAGVFGLNVNIPTIMISTSDGNAIVAAMKNNIVTAFIGNKQNIFGDDLGMFKQDPFIPPATAKPSQLAQNASEFGSMIGSWVHNYGSNVQTNVVLNAEITENGTNVYSETSTNPQTINSGDSTFFVLPDFSLASYGGFYELTYNISSDSTDLFPPDNQFKATFLIDDYYSYGYIDPVTMLPNNRQYFRIADNTSGFSACSFFQDPNASRVKATGIHMASQSANDDSLPGQIISAELWQWNDAFTDINDAFFADISPIASGDYLYLTDQQGEIVFVPFTNEVGLEDDVRYVFCSKTIDDRLFLGHEGILDYDENRNNALVTGPQPINLINDGDDGSWNVVGFGTDVAASVALQLEDNDVSVNEINDLTTSPAYPNPTANTISIPLRNEATNGSLEIFDVEGRMVSAQQVRFNGNTMIVDVSDISNGAYTFQLSQDNGARQSFSVVVNK